MKNIVIHRSQVNVEALDESVRNGVGTEFIGLSTRRGEVALHFTDSVSTEQINTAQQLVNSHDPSILSSRQAEEQARQQEIVQARSANTKGLDLAAYDGASGELQALAQKVAWLELEVRELRGL